MSISQLIIFFKSLVDTTPEVSGFSYGRFSEYNIASNKSYPHLYLDVETETTPISEARYARKVNLYLLGTAIESPTNALRDRTTEFAHLEIIAQNLLVFIRNVRQKPFDSFTPVSMVDVYNIFNDRTFGIIMTIEIVYTPNVNICDATYPNPRDWTYCN